MAGHSKFKNIQHRKGAQDKKRSNIFTKLIREISVAAKLGSSDININPRLKSAITEAKANNMPKDTIERAINKAILATDTNAYESLRYEGYGPNGVAFIIETLTDNRNRTASLIREVLNKNGGLLSEIGSVNFMFDNCGIINFARDIISYDEVLLHALDAEEILKVKIIDITKHDDEISIITPFKELHVVSEYLAKKLQIEYKSAKLEWIPHTYIDIADDEVKNSITKLKWALEGLDDVQKVFNNYNYV